MRWNVSLASIGRSIRIRTLYGVIVWYWQRGKETGSTFTPITGKGNGEKPKWRLCRISFVRCGRERRNEMREIYLVILVFCSSMLIGGGVTMFVFALTELLKVKCPF